MTTSAHGSAGHQAEGGGEYATLLRAVERIAHTLETAGMPRMAGRVFAYVLAEDAERYTAGQLAAGLQVSPAAISGALRYLTSTRMLAREREPGVRGEIYRVYDEDVWRRIILARVPLLETFEHSMDDAIRLIGADHPGGRRLVESREFFAFMRRELPELMQRWAEHRTALLREPPRPRSMM